MRRAALGILAKPRAAPAPAEPVGSGGGEPAGPTAYRYFRLVITAGGQSYIGTNTLALRETVGGTDAVQGSGGTASAEDSHASYPPARAFDGDVNTGWLANLNLPIWLEWDFGAGNEKAIVEYIVGAYANTSRHGSRSATAWTLEGSNDHAAWDVLDTRSGETGWVEGETRSYEVTA